MPQGEAVSNLIIIAAMFLLLWVLLIRPQRARQQKQQQMLSSIEIGDEVLTVGGLYGIVREIDEEDDLVVEIAEGIQVRIARKAVGTTVRPEDEDYLEDENEAEGAGVDLVTVADDEASLEATQKRLS
jgi:preprotein translocase subunit YajC